MATTCLTHLWLPVLLAAVLAFIMSSLVHMLFKWHNSDYRPLSNEDEVRAAIRKGQPAPGQYVIPYCLDMKKQGEAEMQAKYAEGPMGMLYLWPNGPVNMGKKLGSWFLFLLAISFCVAYLLSRTLAPGTSCLQVFRVAATLTFLIHAGGAVPGAIWMGKPWRVAFKEGLDALLYGLVTGLAFSWLWPR